jgi:GDP-L-fucose synthase
MRITVTGGNGCLGRHVVRVLAVIIGTGIETPIRELTERIAAICGFTGSIVWDATQPNGQPRRALDVSRAQSRFGFKATTALQDGLETTIGWYQRCRTRELTL